MARSNGFIDATQAGAFVWIAKILTNEIAGSMSSLRSNNVPEFIYHFWLACLDGLRRQRRLAKKNFLLQRAELA
jgi:hypothetical protein